MEVIPAIDLFAGRLVRLKRGALEEKTEYPGEPWLSARKFQDAGAVWLHVVDLNAAFSGKPENLDAFSRIRDSVACRLQVGGGIRSMESAKAWFDLGADRIVLSTLLSEDFAEASRIARRYPGKVLASIDLKTGSFCIRGWKESVPLPSFQRIRDVGFAGIVFTDVEADGTLQGQRGDLLEGLDIPLPYFVAGGIRSLEDVSALRRHGASGIIVGKSLYETGFPLSEALEAARC